ncbi:type IV toxin-antitoxin system AbiEi family antitoxin [Leifsonia poae]|uniref:type IV toxin-antitoxin system AbiEi family antitoxin n=1 Tax=Leifsonia poae TaxID=110933 RepID=UPI003D667859
MTALIPRLLDSAVLPLAELQAARLDGQLYRVGDAFATVDTPDTAELRAAAFRLSAPRAAVADRLTASWIHGARAGPPVTLQVCVDSAHRISARTLQGLDVRQCILSRGDVVKLGDARVTSPLRTVVDLLRTVDRLTHGLAVELHVLLRLGDDDIGSCQERILRQHRVPGTRRALDRLAGLATFEPAPEQAQPERAQRERGQTEPAAPEPVNRR